MIPAGSVVLLTTGWGQRWPNAQDYIGIPSDKTNLTDLNFLGDPDKPYTFSPFDVKAGSFMNFPGLGKITVIYFEFKRGQKLVEFLQIIFWG